MKHTFAALIALTLVTTLLSPPSHAQESKEGRVQLARMAVALETPRDALMSGTNPLTQQPMFQQVLAQMDWRPVNEQAAQMMAEMFTGSEIKALIAFKQSDVGQSIANKMPGYQRMVGAMLQNEMKATYEARVLPAQVNAATKGGTPAATQPFVPGALPNLTPATGGQGTPIGR